MQKPVMLAAINSGITRIKAKNLEIIQIPFKHLKIPIKIHERKTYDYIEIVGPSNFDSFEYRKPGDISSCSFFSFGTLSKKSQIQIKDVNINDTNWSNQNLE